MQLLAQQLIKAIEIVKLMEALSTGNLVPSQSVQKNFFPVRKPDQGLIFSAER
jgi:hypothetical protein